MKALAALLVATLSAAAVAQTRPSFDATYGVLGDRNMFLRERHKPRSPDEISRGNRNSQRRQPTAEQSLVLRGVAIEDDQLHAYLEDARGGGILRVSPGDTLADGKIVDIAIDAIAYEAKGRTVWVDVGQDLTGVRGEINPTPSDAATQPGNAGTSPAPAPLPPGGGTLEERMKARRAAQRGNK